MNLLLVTDLEGVAGVDEIPALLEGTAAHNSAQNLLRGEIAAAVDGWSGARTASSLVIGDTHMGGPSGNLSVESLRLGAAQDGKPKLDLRIVRSANPADSAFFSGIDAVACLGMHGGTAGFVPHCVDVCTSFESERGPASEAQLFLGVAAELGIPALFVAGDEAVASVGNVPLIVTKRNSRAVRAHSRPVPEVLAEIRQAAAGRPVAAPRLDGPLALRFRSRWMADLAEAEGAARRDETSVALTGDTLRAKIATGMQLLGTVEAVFAKAIRPWDLAGDLRAILRRPFERSVAPPFRRDAEQALAATLRLTDNSEDYFRANRALCLHMLEAHAPEFFRSMNLAPVLADALARLRAVPIEFPKDLSPEDAMVRLDAMFVLRERGLAAQVDDDALRRYVRSILGKDALSAWLMGEIGHLLGLPTRLALPARPFRQAHRLIDLYWLTHIYLVETRYLHRPLPRPNRAAWTSETEELLLAVPFALGNGHLDIAAEIAFCLQLAGEETAPEHSQILSALAAHQDADGVVRAPDTANTEDGDARLRADAHCTLAALLAFAGAN